MISTLSLPVMLIFAVVFFRDKMVGVKVMALLLAIWGFVSYIYHNYLDNDKSNKVVKDGNDDGKGVA